MARASRAPADSQFVRENIQDVLHRVDQTEAGSTAAVRKRVTTSAPPRQVGAALNRRPATHDAKEVNSPDLEALHVGTGGARIHKAQSAGLASELQACRAALAQRERDLQLTAQAARQEVKELQTNRARQDKAHKALVQQAADAKHAALEARAQADGADLRSKELGKEAQRLTQDKKQEAGGRQAQAVQLQRALNDAQRWQQAAQQAQQELGELRSSQARAGPNHLDVQKLTSENQRLEAQKQELLVLLKKQAKLVDILKRQKAHIEAAQLLSFTQADYVASESMVLP